MLFNSLQFAVFFIIVYILYLVFNAKWQNKLLFAASCIFYGAWDWRFLFLIFTSIITDFLCSLNIYASNNDRKRKILLIISILINLSILGFFKYYNFFIDSLFSFLNLFGIALDNIYFLKVILPVGISFYTFQTMSYTIDVYKRKIEPTKNFLHYAIFVLYFPQLVAGPIMRAKDLLPQIISKRILSLDKFYEGCYLIFWGLFQKIFIADNLAKAINPIFAASPPYNGAKVILALYAFAFQIFCDFAGYSNIARGLGKLMGFDIMVNFNLPYFAINPRDFWQRWHISLSNWLRDYVYIPLGGNRNGRLKTCRNLAVTMLLGGLWHGAAFTFVIWGIYHGLLLILHRLIRPFLGKMFSFKNVLLDSIWYSVKVMFFFQLICIGWLIFRANSLKQVISMMHAIIFNFRLVEGASTGILTDFWVLATYAWFLIVIQLFQFIKNDLMAVYKANTFVKAVIYVVAFYLITIYGVSGGNEFIYFQF